MAIVDGQLANANEVMRVIASNFIDNAQLLFDANYIGFDGKLNNDGVPQLKNVEYDTFTSDSMVSNGNVEYDSTNDLYWGPTEWTESEYTTYDDCDDSSVDTDKWTVTETSEGTATATVTENATQMSLDCTSTDDNLNGSATVESKELNMTDNDALMIQLPSIVLTEDVQSESQFNMKLNSTQILLKEGTNTYSNYKIWIFSKGNSLRYRIYDGSSWNSWSYLNESLSSIWFGISARTVGDNDNASASVKIKKVRYNTLATSIASANDYIVSSGTASTDTITNSICTYNGEVTSLLNAADGTNFENVTKNQIHRYTSTGTTSKTKLVFPGVTSEYATKYNFY